MSNPKLLLLVGCCFYFTVSLSQNIMSIFSHLGANFRVTKGGDGIILTFISFQVRPQAAGIRRSVQAHPEEEGQDHQEAGPQAGVQRVQVEEPGEHSEERL